MPDLNVPGAPPAIVEALERLKKSLEEAAGNNLAGLILYGGLARGRYRPGKSDVNILVLLRDASATALTAIAPALQAAWRAAAVEPMLLTSAELPHAARDFPTKFLDIKRHHLVLAGSDPFMELDIPLELIRLRTEQELRNLLLRTRNRFISAAGDSAVLTQVLARIARPFALALAALLQVAGKAVPEEDRTADIFDAAATALGLEREPLARLAALRQDSRTTGDVAELFRAILGAMTKAANESAQLQEPLP